MGRVIDMVARGSEALPVGQLVAGGTALFGVAGVAAFARTVLMKVRPWPLRIRRSAGAGPAHSAGRGGRPWRWPMVQVAGERIVRDLRRDLFQAIVSQDMGFFDRNRTGELINRLSADTTLVGKSITNNLMDGSRSVLQALVGARRGAMFHCRCRTFSLSSAHLAVQAPPPPRGVPNGREIAQGYP